MNLGVDIADEILSRLPVKSLIRFKVVCKHWYSHIHSDYFIDKHLKNQKTNEKALLHHKKSFNDYVSVCILEEEEDDDDGQDNRTLFHRHQQYYLEDYMPLDSSEYHKYGNIIGTCNGLVCLLYGNDNHTYNRSIYFWNPATRDLKTLPSCESQRLPPATRKSSLLGDHIGFGFDSTSNDYKVIRIVNSEKRKIVNQAMVYSLKTNSWKELDYSNNVSTKMRTLDKFGSTIFLCEKVYWVILGLDMFQKYVLLSFDMGIEVFQMTPLPSEYRPIGTKHYNEGTNLFTLHDSIALVGTQYTPGERRLEIWTTKELEQGRASWIKVSNIGLSSTISNPVGSWKSKNSNDFLVFFIDYEYDGWDGWENVMNEGYLYQ